jgi:HSP20 family protein
MVALTTWDPFRDLEEITNRLGATFGRESPSRSDGGRGGGGYTGLWAPAVDIVEDDKEYLIKAELPEVEKKDVKVTVDHGVLQLTGERRRELDDKKAHRMERFYGNFSRSFTLPEDADGTKIAADFKDGMLRIRVPKSEAARPKEIEVTVS